MPAAPDSVLRLVEKFSLHRPEYTSGAYNEENLRSEFLDPFFEALGWDVSNRSNAAEAYKDLVREESLRAEKLCRQDKQLSHRHSFGEWKWIR